MILDRHAFRIWSFTAERAFKATFTKPEQHYAREMIHDTLREKEIAVYIHIPFCKSICLYCPYVRFPLRNGKILTKYIEGLKAEIKTYGQLLSPSICA